MLGKCSAQRGLFDADTMYLDFVGRDSFYGFLAAQRSHIFNDEDFADLHCQDNGRDSVPPSQLATALLLHCHRIPCGSASTVRGGGDMPPPARYIIQGRANHVMTLGGQVARLEARRYKDEALAGGIATARSPAG
jgi:hypothetical protein